MAQLIFDTLAYARDLENAGVDRAQAEVQAEALHKFEERHSQRMLAELATKSELSKEIFVLKTELREEITAIRTELKEEIAAVRAELKEEIAAVRTELKEEIAAVRAELKEEIAAVRAELKEDIAAVRTELRKETQSIRGEMRELELRLSIEIQKSQNVMRNWFISMAVGMSAVMIGGFGLLITYFPK